MATNLAVRVRLRVRHVRPEEAISWMGYQVIIKEWFCGAPQDSERCTPESPYHFSSPNAKRRTNMYFCGSIDRAVRCDGKGCMEEVVLDRDHLIDYSMLRASSYDGWFFRKDDTEAWCFEHLSIGLIAWRDRTNPGWRGRLKGDLASKLPSVESARRVASSARVRYNGSGSSANLTRGGSDEQGES